MDIEQKKKEMFEMMISHIKLDPHLQEQADI